MGRDLECQVVRWFRDSGERRAVVDAALGLAREGHTYVHRERQVTRIVEGALGG